MRLLIAAFGCLGMFLAFSQDTLKTVSADLVLQQQVQKLEKRILELETEKQAATTSVFQDIQVGLSFGFNYFLNGEQSYYLKQDSTIGAFGNKQGVSGMLSALLGYRILEKHSVFLNVPLGDISPNPNQAIGVFNKKVAGGLGYGFNYKDLSLIAVINIFPYRKPALELLENYKLEGEPLSVVDVQTLPSTMAYSPSITLGVCYNLLGNSKTRKTLLSAW
jgi:hypothetical protein